MYWSASAQKVPYALAWGQKVMYSLSPSRAGRPGQTAHQFSICHNRVSREYKPHLFIAKPLAEHPVGTLANKGALSQECMSTRNIDRTYFRHSLLLFVGLGAAIHYLHKQSTTLRSQSTSRLDPRPKRACLSYVVTEHST